MRYLLLRMVLFMALPVGLALPAAAQQTGYTVQGVEVQATASDGTTARMEALAQGEVAAFSELLSRHMPPEQAAARAAATPPHVISRMVRGYEVSDEKVSGTGYAARLDVNFDAAQVDAFLRAGQSVPAATSPTMAQPAPPVAPPSPPSAAASAPAASVFGQNMLVIPVWNAEADNPLLWEKANAWRQAWNAAERTDTRFIRLPIGDQSDRMTLDPVQAIHTEFTGLSVIAERYQSSTVVVAIAEPTVSAGTNALSVLLRRLSPTGQSGELPLVYQQEAGESMDMTMERAAQDIIYRLMQEGQQRALDQTRAAQAAAQPAPDVYAPRSKITVLSRLDRLNDWVGLRKRLLALTEVEQVDLSAISNRQVDLIVHYRGSPVQLEAAMQAQGIRVQKAPNYWIVGF